MRQIFLSSQIFGGFRPFSNGARVWPVAVAKYLNEFNGLEAEGDTVARIAGVNIPTQKRVEIGLRYIHGIGAAKAKEICEQGRHRRDRRVTI